MKRAALPIAFMMGLAVGVALAGRMTAPPGGFADSSRAAAGSEVLAVVGAGAITVADYANEIERRGAANFASARARRELLDDMVRVAALAEAARAAGYESDPDVYRDRQLVLAGRYRRDHLEPVLAKVEVASAEVEEFYERHRDRYRVPAAVRLAALFFAYPDAVSDEARRATRARAAAIREQAIAEGADEPFAILAARHSDDQATRYRGGDLGWVVEGEIAERWGADGAAAIAELADGAESISRPVVGPEGVYLFRVVEVRGAEPMPFSQVESSIRQELYVKAQEAVRARFYASLAEEIHVVVDEDRLAALPLPAPAKRPEMRPPPLPRIGS